MTQLHAVTVVVALLALATLAAGASTTIPEELAGPGTEDGSEADNSSTQANASADTDTDMQAPTARTSPTSNGQDAIDTPAPGDGEGPGGWLSTSVWIGLGVLGLAAVGVHRREDHAREKEPERRALEHPGVDGALLLARQAHREEEHRIAEEWCATAIELDDTRVIAHLCRGMCRIELGELEQAVRSLTRALELETSATILYHLARAHALRGDVDEAVKAIAPLAEADPAVVERIHEEPAFADLNDHPRWLAALGELG